MKKTCKIYNSTQAFTLVELASVLVIVALIIGMSVSAGITVIGSTKAAATQQKMAAIDQALMAYRMTNDRLPCPSDLTQVQGGSTAHTTAYGVAGTCAIASPYHTSITGAAPWGVRTFKNSAGTVTVTEGGVPVYDLGLPYDFMYDGWGNRIRYAVDVTMANTGTNTNTFSGTQIGCENGQSQFTIQGDPMPSTSTYTVGSHNYTRSGAAIYALISHGPNGHGAFTRSGTILNAGSLNADELANCNCTSSGSQNTANSYAITGTYVQEQPYTYNLANPLYNFDDIVTYKERWQMTAPSDTAGTACLRVYVADTNNQRIEVFDMNGNYVSQITATSAFSNPQGVFVDNASNVWVADSVNNRIQKCVLSSSGTATCTPITLTASGIGLADPTDVVVDSSGNIWVADVINARILEFNSSYNFILGIGAGYQTAGGTIGNTGYANGQFSAPYGFGIDPAGNIWVTDNNNNRVQEFSSSGAWLASYGGGGSYPATCTNTSIPACNSGSGTGSPQFNAPSRIGIDQVGNIWVGDYGNNRIVELSNSGTYITSLSTGSGSDPSMGAVDPSGNVWEANSNNGTMEKWTNNAGTWSSTTYGSSGSGNGQLNLPNGISIPQVR